jgi:glycosyltransferase involved in cell wall biosynthesis
MVETHHCGMFVDPERPQDFADKILELKKDPARVTQMGNNARMLAESTYDKSILCAQFAGVVNGLILKQ